MNVYWTKGWIAALEEHSTGLIVTVLTTYSFTTVFFAYLTFDLSIPEQNYTAENGATICFGDYVKAWANNFIRAHPHQLIHIPISHPTNQHWFYAFICKGERKVFLKDSMAVSENILFVFDLLLAFVEACMKFGNFVDPRSNEWTL